MALRSPFSKKPRRGTEPFKSHLDLYSASELAVVTFDSDGEFLRAADILMERREIPYDVLGERRLVVPRDYLEILDAQRVSHRTEPVGLSKDARPGDVARLRREQGKF